jgi:hypothetical protein
MKTKEEILKKHGLQIGFKSTYGWDSILKAMEEYASQFKQTDVNPPVMQAEGSDVSEGAAVAKAGGLQAMCAVCGQPSVAAACKL